MNVFDKLTKNPNLFSFFSLSLSFSLMIFCFHTFTKINMDGLPPGNTGCCRLMCLLSFFKLFSDFINFFSLSLSFFLMIFYFHNFTKIT